MYKWLCSQLGKAQLCNCGSASNHLLFCLEAMINVIGFLFIIAVSVALGYVILTGIYPEVAPAVSLVIYGVTAYVVHGSVSLI